MTSAARQPRVPPHVDPGLEFRQALPGPPPRAALPAPQPSHEEIAHLANLLWTARGRDPGHALDDWLEAEAQLTGREVVAAV